MLAGPSRPIWLLHVSSRTEFAKPIWLSDAQGPGQGKEEAGIEFETGLKKLRG